MDDQRGYLVDFNFLWQKNNARAGWIFVWAVVQTHWMTRSKKFWHSRKNQVCRGEKYVGKYLLSLTIFFDFPSDTQYNSLLIPLSISYPS